MELKREYDYDCVETGKYDCENCWFLMYNDQRFKPKTMCIETRRKWMLNNRNKQKTRSLFDDVQKFKFETDGTDLNKYESMLYRDYVDKKRYRYYIEGSEGK